MAPSQQALRLSQQPRLLLNRLKVQGEIPAAVRFHVRTLLCCCSIANVDEEHPPKLADDIDQLLAGLKEDDG